MAYLLGLDIGTTGAKALLIDQAGKVVASAGEGYSIQTPKPLWSEQNPEDWWQATVKCFRRVTQDSGITKEEVTAIGLSGQMHGLVLLDRNGNLLRPCIMWNDQRTAGQCASITKKLGFKLLLKLTGNPVLPGFTAPKILWVRENEPTIYERAHHTLLPKDYVRLRLTGEYATEVSDASGTSLLDVRKRTWSDEMLKKLEVPKEWMPTVAESIEVTGRISRSAAEATGLKEGTPVVGGGGDQAAGAVGSGVVRPGVVSVTVGTSGVVFAHSRTLKVEPKGLLHSFCHAVPGAWHLMGVTLAAGGSLRWFRDTLGAEERSIANQKGVDPYEIMMSEAEQAPTGCEGLVFLPYLSGERTPYPDPFARGAFVGLTVRHSKSHMIRSILEGVAFSLRDCLELMKSLKVPIKEVRISGGGARSPLWRQIIADVFHMEMVTVTSTEGAPYGAALLAGVGAGVYSSVQEACAETIRPSSRTDVNRSRSAIYNEQYSVYRDLYPSLRTSLHSLSNDV